MKEHIQLCIEQNLGEGVFVTELPDTAQLSGEKEGT